MLLEKFRSISIVPHYRGVPNPGAVGSNPAGGARFPATRDMIGIFCRELAERDSLSFVPAVAESSLTSAVPAANNSARTVRDHFGCPRGHNREAGENPARSRHCEWEAVLSLEPLRLVELGEG